jgi:hypothetical protein
MFENQLSQKIVEHGEKMDEIIDVDYFFLDIYDSKLAMD